MSNFEVDRGGKGGPKPARSKVVGRGGSTGAKGTRRAWFDRGSRGDARKGVGPGAPGETWAWWGDWLPFQAAPDGEPRDGLTSAASEMAAEIAGRLALPEEKLAVLDLICYRGLLRAVPKLRRLGVVSKPEFCRRLGLSQHAAERVLEWLVSLGLARAGFGLGNAWEIPVAVVEVCQRLKAARGENWWQEQATKTRP